MDFRIGQEVLIAKYDRTLKFNPELTEGIIHDIKTDRIEVLIDGRIIVFEDEMVGRCLENEYYIFRNLKEYNFHVREENDKKGLIDKIVNKLNGYGYDIVNHIYEAVVLDA